jgi:hypothetical protein
MNSVNGTMVMMNSRMQKMPKFEALTTHRMIWRMFVAIALLLASISFAFAGPREQAQRIHDRLAGVPAEPGVLDDMTNAIQADANNGPLVAAHMAMDNASFYTVTLKNLAAPWTNRDQDPFVPLNDYITTVIGLVKDDEPFDQILYDDVLYVGSGVSPAPSASSNAHYEALEQRMQAPNFDPTTEIVRTTQSSVYPVPATATAGAMTTRAAAESFFIAGTNRAMFRFTLMNHMCMDLEQVHDVSIVPDRIRQDVSRSPGGDSRVFLNNCIGCHAGMDPMAQAFAYYNFDDVSASIEYTAGSVQPKYFNNEETFADGFVTPDDAWENYWREGQNALIGWNPGLPGSGNGAKSMGMELAGSQAFAQCQVEKVFQAVCLRAPGDDADRLQVGSMAVDFGATFDLRQVFAESAKYCMGN